MSNSWISADPVVVNEKAKILLEEVLNRPEFHQEGWFPWLSSWKESLDQWLFDQISLLLGSQNLERFWNFISGLDYLALFILIVLIVVFWGYLLLKGGRIIQRSSQQTLNIASTPEVSAIELRQEAKATADAGDWGGAVRLNFRAVLVRLGELRTINYRPGKTDQECLEEFKKQVPQKLCYLERLVELFERKWYGSLSCSRQDYEESEALLRELWERRNSFG